MGNKLEKILNIAEQANNSDNIILWTHAFKAHGKLFTDRTNTTKGIISLTNAKICSHFDACECGDECQCEEPCECNNVDTFSWLNVFEDEIISFTIIRK